MEHSSAFKLCFLVLLNFIKIQTQAACTSGWYGSQCQYSCHCSTSTSCDVNCQCPSQCASGWFGLGCQYQDLATIPGAIVITSSLPITTTWLTDGSDTTCNTDPNIQFMKISWNTSYPFTWLRFKVKDSYAKLNFILTFKTHNNLTNACSVPQIFDLDATTVDYRCDINETIQELIVTGIGLKSLCSLYVSGGRNFALRQSTTQSSLWGSELQASVAVDGNTDGYFHSHSCTHTHFSDLNPEWTISLDSAKVINRILLYNRDDCCSERLRYFKLETLQPPTDTVLWTYQDTGETLPVYSVTGIQNNPVIKIRITATNLFENYLVLTLCEVMMFGECTPGTWGLECSQSCPKECNTTCHQDIGSCMNKECVPGTWGLECSQSCPKECNTTCHHDTGSCRTFSDCNKAIKDSETSTMTFEVGIGIGIAAGCVAVVITVVVMVMVPRVRRKRDQQISDRRQGTQLEPYDSIKQGNEYYPSYDDTAAPDTSNRSGLKIASKMSSYENSPSSVYDTIGETTKVYD